MDSTFDPFDDSVEPSDPSVRLVLAVLVACALLPTVMLLLLLLVLPWTPPDLEHPFWITLRQRVLAAIEAVGVTIFVGMSVDYCLHTAHAYSHSESETRRGKVTDALTHMGISILGAFVTTVGSTVFLFPVGFLAFYLFPI